MHILFSTRGRLYILYTYICWCIEVNYVLKSMENHSNMKCVYKSWSSMYVMEYLPRTVNVFIQDNLNKCNNLILLIPFYLSLDDFCCFVSFLFLLMVLSFSWELRLKTSVLDCGREERFYKGNWIYLSYLWKYQECLKDEIVESVKI